MTSETGSAGKSSGRTTWWLLQLVRQNKRAYGVKTVAAVAGKIFGRPRLYS